MSEGLTVSVKMSEGLSVKMSVGLSDAALADS